ncbi:GMP synthase [Rubellimicrobium mesophilum DSM 19309]|uniref:GMP synthase n=1 Tax=Rubellimicrobium mesophilum DSM 19309 TaxID=442562 RepID=A0A017HX52_9RHOB|nr:type 1 glutamine amidotransferase [Rubellimicrobium mesophilum]EYD78344.1 GMP synthase [Rubellimicrobium mesophilum DSM 19309]
MLIGILQTGHAPDALRPTHGDYPDLFAELLKDKGLTFRTWSIVDGEFPSGPHDAEGWLITGSRHGAYEDHPWIPPLEALIRDIVAEKVPLVGICFGHQIIAQALGGKVEKYPGGWSVGRTEYDFGGDTIALNAWHQDQVTQRPEGAEVVASSPFCENAALVYGDRAFTVQAHPEFNRPFLADMIEKRGRGLVPDPLLDAARTAVEQPLDDDKLASRIARFFHEGVAA